MNGASASSSTPPVDPQKIDDLLSKEFQKLSFHDRNAINEEMHGVRVLAPEESPELLEDSLNKLSVELRRLREHHRQHRDSTAGSAYDTACSLEESYIHTDKFRLRFLRTELMNPILAAERLVTFLDRAVEFYGEKVLHRPVRLEDLGKDGLELLRSGDYQPLPFRDRTGRRIIAFVNNFGLCFPIHVRIKVIYYLHWVLTEDVETQRKGLVGIHWWPCSASKRSNVPIPFSDAAKGAKLYAGHPARVTAIHVCLPNSPNFAQFRSILALGLSKETRYRFKVHKGEGLIVQYSLHGYGIPVELLPVTETGNVKTANLKQWIKLRKFRERTSSTTANSEVPIVVDCPGLKDVIFRVGDSYFRHPGNVWFRGCIEAKYDAFENASSEEKERIVCDIVDGILNSDGHFLEWGRDPKWWIVVKDRGAMRLKVLGAFRNHRRRVKGHWNAQEVQSNTDKFVNQDGRKRQKLDAGDDNGSSCFYKCLS